MSGNGAGHDLSKVDYGMVDHPGPVAWPEAARKEIEQIFSRYPDKRSATLRSCGWRCANLAGSLIKWS